MPYDPDLSLEDDEQDPTDQSSPFRQLRDHSKKLEKELRQRDKELEELRTFKADFEASQKKQSVSKTFGELGLTEKHAELFLKANPEAEVTAEVVQKFAEEYGLVEAKEQEEDSGFSPLAATDGVPASKEPMKASEFWALYSENPHAALEQAKKGRVKFDSNL